MLGSGGPKAVPHPTRVWQQGRRLPPKAAKPRACRAQTPGHRRPSGHRPRGMAFLFLACHAHAHSRAPCAGTEAVIRACLDCGVPALVYTSTYNVVFGGQPILAGDESMPYFPLDRHCDAYSRSKAEAEQAVLRADGTRLPGGGTLRCTALRPAGIYGAGEERHLARAAAAAQMGWPWYAFGSADVRVDMVHVRARRGGGGGAGGGGLQPGTRRGKRRSSVPGTCAEGLAGRHPAVAGRQPRGRAPAGAASAGRAWRGKAGRPSLLHLRCAAPPGSGGGGSRRLAAQRDPVGAGLLFSPRPGARPRSRAGNCRSGGRDPGAGLSSGSRDHAVRAAVAAPRAWRGWLLRPQPPNSPSRGMHGSKP